MYETIAWLVGLFVVSSYFFRKGIRVGIKHSLLTLKLTEEQVHILNEEIKKKGYNLSSEAVRETPKKMTDIEPTRVIN